MKKSVLLLSLLMSIAGTVIASDTPKMGDSILKCAMAERKLLVAYSFLSRGHYGSASTILCAHPKAMVTEAGIREIAERIRVSINSEGYDARPNRLYIMNIMQLGE